MYDSAKIVAPATLLSPLPPRGGTRTVTRSDLVRSAGLLGSDYVFNDSAPADEAVLHGQFDTLHLRPGLILHAAAVRDLRTMRTRNALNPGVKIVVVIDGHTDLSFGHHRFDLGPQGQDPGARNRGALVNLAEIDTFSRRWQRDRHERKVSLTLTPEWLDLDGGDCAAAAGLKAFTQAHLACQPWTVSARARELARQILEPSSFLPGLQRLRLESRCIELATEALSALEPAPVPAVAPALREADRRRLARLEDLLHSEEIVGLSTADIARDVGSNPTTLQALARRAWGCTVFERLRDIRMDKAHQLLAGGAGVAQAAEVAGYASAPNFSTAFKRRYHCSPREVRAC